MSDQELLPCPFCGSRAEFGDDGDGGRFVTCTEPTCLSSSNIRYPLKEDVRPLLTEQWNRRAMLQAAPTPPPLPSEEEIAFAICDARIPRDYKCVERGCKFPGSLGCEKEFRAARAILALLNRGR